MLAFMHTRDSRFCLPTPTGAPTARAAVDALLRCEAQRVARLYRMLGVDAAAFERGVAPTVRRVALELRDLPAPPYQEASCSAFGLVLATACRAAYAAGGRVFDPAAEEEGRESTERQYRVATVCDALVSRLPQLLSALCVCDAAGEFWWSPAVEDLTSFYARTIGPWTHSPRLSAVDDAMLAAVRLRVLSGAQLAPCEPPERPDGARSTSQGAAPATGPAAPRGADLPTCRQATQASTYASALLGNAPDCVRATAAACVERAWRTVDLRWSTRAAPQRPVAPGAPARGAQTDAMRTDAVPAVAARVETAPADAVRAHAAPVGAAPVEAIPADAVLCEPVPVEPVPVEAVAAEAAPADGTPADGSPFECVPAATAPVGAVRGRTAPVATVPVAAMRASAALSMPVAVPPPRASIAFPAASDSRAAWIAAARRLLADGVWQPNNRTGRVWFGAAGCALLWPLAGRDLARTFGRTGDDAPSWVAARLLEHGLILCRPGEQAPAGALWHVTAQPRPRPFCAVLWSNPAVLADPAGWSQVSLHCRAWPEGAPAEAAVQR